MDEEQSIKLLRQFINSSGKAVFIYEVDTRAVTYISKGFERIWETSDVSLKANPAGIVSTIHPEDKEYLTKEYTSVLAGSTSKNTEFRIILKDGSIKWLLSTVHLFTDEKGKRYISGAVDDISSLKENIGTLQKFAAKKDAILEVLSHDLAGPLATIKTLSSLLTKHLKDYNNEDINNIVSIIYESSARSIRLIRDFIDQEFLESTNPALIKIRMNLVEKLKEILEEYEEAGSILRKNFKFLSSSDQVYVYLDQGKFMQVVNNLISNAIKFTHDDGTITVNLTEHEEVVTLVVQDDGVGIPEKFHGVLFDKFTQARREGLKGEPTIGLGMSIIKTIVEWHGGRIWFESKENEGTTFYIELPKK